MMTSEESTNLLRSEKEKRNRVLERACIDEHGFQFILTLDQLVDLHHHVREWLMRDWDPIGVCGEREAAEEYYSYERGVADILRTGTEEDLSKHLKKIVSEQMGLTAEFASGQAAASKLFHSYREWMRNLEKPNAP